MPERSSLKPAPASLPTLSPQGTQAGKPAMPLGRPFTLLGSRNRAHLHLVSSTISRNHACIIVTDNGLYIRDLASRTGVVVNGRRVKEADLRDGDTLQIGSFKFKFADPAGPVRFPLTPKAASALLDIHGGAQTPLDSRTLLIGRRPTADIPVNDASISNTHAMIFEVNGQRFIRDLGSRTGTLVNGKPVHHQLLEFGDEIKIGDVHFRFLAAQGQNQPQLEEGFAEPQLDEDEPIGIDFSAEEPVVQASKNGELAPIPVEDLDEAPIRPASTEQTGGQGAVPEPERALAARDHLDVPDEDQTIPPTSFAEGGDLGLNFVAEAPEPAAPLGLQAAMPEEPANQPEHAVAPVEAGEEHPGSEYVLPDSLPIEPQPVAADAGLPSDITADPADMTAVGPDLTATPVPDLHGLTGTTESIQIESEVDQTAEIARAEDHAAVAPEAPPAWESAPADAAPEPTSSEPTTENAPAEESQTAIEDDIGLSPVAPAVDETPPAEASEPSHSYEHTQAAEQVPPAPVVQQVDLSAMRFDEPAAVEMAPEAVEAPEPQAPQPLLNLPPEPVEEPPPTAGPASARSAPSDAAIAPEVPVAAAGAAALSAAAPLAESIAPAAMAAAELASPTLEPPSAKTKRRPRAPRGKGKTAPQAEVSVNPPAPPGVEAAPAPAQKRRRGSRKKPASDAPAGSTEDDAAVAGTAEAPPVAPIVAAEALSTESIESAAQAQSSEAPATAEVSAAEVPSRWDGSEASTPVDPEAILAIESESVAARRDMTTPVESDASAPQAQSPDEFSPEQDWEAQPSSAEAEQPPVELARTPPTEAAPEESAPLDESAPHPGHEPTQVDGQTVQFEHLGGLEATAPTAVHLSSEWSQTASTEPQAGHEAISFAAFSADEPASSEEASNVAADVPHPTTDVAEVLEPTDPTPESALAIESPLDQIEVSEPVAEASQQDSPLTDTAFGQVVQEFSGDGSGSLVEDTSPSVDSASSSEPVTEREQPAAETTPVEDAVPVAEELPAEAERAESIDFTETADDFDFDLPEPDLAIDLSDTPAERAIGGNSGPAPASAPVSSLSSTESIAPTRKPSFNPPATGRAAEPVPPQAPGARAAQPAEPLPPNISMTPPPAQANPFLGMSRDMDSFIGGMPLSLGPAARAVPPPTAPAAPPGEPPPITFSDDADPIPPLDLDVSDEPLELFDGAPEKLDAIPDSLGPASKLDGTLVPDVPSQGVPPAAPPRAVPAVQPPSATGAVKPMRQVAPPPPPRTSPLRSFTGGPQAVVPPPTFPSNVSVTPPFGSAAPPPPQRLTAPATREVDVFSNTAFPPLDPTVFGIAKRPTAPAPGPARRQPAPPTEAELMELARTPRQQPVLPNRQPPPKAAPAEPPPRRPWYKRLTILLPLMILAILLVIVFVIFFPPRHTVQGSLQLQGLNREDMGVVHQTVGSLRNLLGASARLATGTLKQQNLDAGFLADPETISAMSEAVNSPFDEARSQLQFRVASRNVEADRTRMSALLAALYAESGSANDAALKARAQVEQAQVQLTDLQKRQSLQEGLERKRAEQVTAAAVPPAQAMLLNPREVLLQVQQDDQQLRKAMDDAATKVQERREALRMAQVKAAQSDAQAAAELRTLRQSIDGMASRLQAVRLAQSGQIDEASKKFSAALDDFSAQLATVSVPSGDKEAAAYLRAARSAIEQVRQQSDQLTARARQDAQSVEQLRREIADRREAHLRQVWAQDVPLQQLLEQRDGESHRYNVAVDSGYGEEAGKIKGVLEDLDKKIDARRSTLATGGQFADDLQQNLQTAIERMESDRQQDERELAAKLKLLEAPADVPALAKLSQSASSLIGARQAYGSAAALSATEADTEARRLQGEIAERQARLDTLRQDPSNRSALDAARKDLDSVQAAEAKASAAYTANQATVRNLRQLVDTRADAEDLATRVQQKREELEQLQRAVAASPVVLKPDEASVDVVYAPDTRVQYMVAGVIVVLLLFAGPLWMSFGSADSHIPLSGTMIESYDVPGHEADELSAQDHFEEQHPAPV